jgi:hypothetical protein
VGALAVSGFLFGTVIVVVCTGGLIAALASMRRHPRGGGGLWFFRGESDSAPVSGPGSRTEDRRVIDPAAPPSDEPAGEP